MIYCSLTELMYLKECLFYLAYFASFPTTVFPPAPRVSFLSVLPDVAQLLTFDIFESVEETVGRVQQLLFVCII